MKILVSHEFYQLFRGDKDFILPRLVADKLKCDVSILCPDTLSPSDQIAGFTFSKDLFIERSGLNPESVYFHSSLLRVRKTHNKEIPYVIPGWSYVRQLWRLHPDLILDAVYTTLTPRSFINWLYCTVMRKKRILLDAGDEGNKKYCLPLERRAVRSARKIFTYSQGGVSRMQAKYQIADPDKFFIHLKLLTPDRFQYLESFTRTPYTVGYVGRFLRAKGFNRFLELAGSSTLPGVEFRAVGANTDRFDIPSGLNVSPYVENHKLAEVYSSIDLLVLPDMRNFRGYSTVAQEALMCGTEVALGCLDRSFYPKEEGVFFFDPDRPEDLTAYISEKARRPMGEKIAARRLLAAEYRRATDGSGFLQELEKQINTEG